jgi:hypothetical protein
MSTIVLSTLALLECAFLIYVFFHWLREELNPKKPPKRYLDPAGSIPPRRRFVVRPRQHHRS